MAFLTEAPPPRSTPLPVLPGIRRLVAPNPGPMTFHGTNTWLIETRAGLLILDPGPAAEAHLDAVAAAAGGGAAAILLSHGHSDHAAGAALLAGKLGAPVFAHEDFTGDAAVLSRRLRAGERIGELTCLHTPGHAPDHLCFAFPGGIVFTGDQVMAWSSSVVPWPSGDMRAFLASLETLRDRADRLHLPGHGPPLPDPSGFIDELISRRRGREAAILAVIAEGPLDPAEIVRRLYAGRGAPLFGAAVHNVRSHLDKLMAEGRAVPDDDGRWARLSPIGA